MAGIFLLFYLFQLHFAKGLYLVKHLSIRGKHRNMNINITSRCTLLFAEDIKMKERNAVICLYLQCYQEPDPTFLSGRFR